MLQRKLFSCVSLFSKCDGVLLSGETVRKYLEFSSIEDQITFRNYFGCLCQGRDQALIFISLIQEFLLFSKVNEQLRQYAATLSTDSIWHWFGLPLFCQQQLYCQWANLTEASWIFASFWLRNWTHPTPPCCATMGIWQTFDLILPVKIEILIRKQLAGYDATVILIVNPSYIFLKIP